MSSKEFIEKVFLRLPTSVILLVEVLRYWQRLCRYNASFHTDDDMRKMQYTLLRENHVIEKGMSMKTTRKGFGQMKVRNLIERLSKYADHYTEEDREFLRYPLCTISSYIAFQKNDGVDMQDIEEAFEALRAKTRFGLSELNISSGIASHRREELTQAALGDFRSLLNSRHSIRYFRDELPSTDTIEKALSLASRTPSACNRQAWHTHVYFGAEAHRLLKKQGGCNGFAEDIPCCIVVTSDMKGFLSYEPFQCYVDGGLYAQNLINALNYVGLGTIPLSCGFLTYRLLRIQKQFGIPENEAMVVMIGTGHMCDEMKIAESTRKPLSYTNTFHTNQ